MKSISRGMAFCLFNRVSDLVENGDIEQLIGLGVTLEQANDIATLKPVQINRLKDCIDLEIDRELLLEALTTIDEADEEDLEHHINTAALILNQLGLMACEMYVPVDLKELDLPRETVNLLADATALDFRRAARTGIKFFTLSADELKLSMTLAHILNEIREEEMLTELILADASFTMLNTITGVRKRWFTEQRAKYNLPVSAGGPPNKLSYEDSVKAYRVWEQSQNSPLVERCLEVHKALGGVALRDIWTSIKDWCQNEELGYKETA